MKKFDLPVVEVVYFQAEDIICTSSPEAGGFYGEEHDISNAGTGGGAFDLPMDPA